MGAGIVQAEDMVTLRVPFAAPSVSQVRASLRSWMREHGLTGAGVEDARVVVSELVANSVRHAQPLPTGELEVSWCLHGDDLEIAVTDGGSASSSPHAVDATTSALSGRGLSIVERLVDRWWVEDGRGDCTVYTCLSL